MQYVRPFERSPEEKELIISRVREYLINMPEIVAGFLFGSFLDGPFRDIDIGLVLDASFIPPRYYEQRIEQELIDHIHFPVDIRILNTAPIRFSYQVIKKQQVVLCKNLNALSAFESRIIREYFDYAYYLNRYRRGILGII